MNSQSPPKPEVGDYADEAIQCLVRNELLRGPNSDPERMHDALRGIGWAILSLKEKPAITSMLDHCAETDHVLELRLIDTDVFGVRCSAPHCPFHTEWRT